MLQYFLEVEMALTCLLLGGTEVCDRQEEADECELKRYLMADSMILYVLRIHLMSC